MNTFRKLIAAGAVSALALIVAAPAMAGGLFPGFPAATSPLTGNETIPADTNLSGGLNPQTELVSPAQIVGAGNTAANPGVIESVPIGSVAYASFGTATTLVSGTTYIIGVNIVGTRTLSGCAALANGTVGTNKLLCALYNSSGALVANSALAGATTSGANTFQVLAFTSTYQAIGPGKYYIVVQGNGATDGIRTVATSTFLGRVTSSATGVFGTLPATITVPTTFTADVGPIAYLY